MENGINSAELQALLDYYEKEKGISKEALNEAIKEAVEAAARKASGASNDVRVETDPKTGAIRVFAQLLVVDRVTDPQSEITRFDALQLVDEAKVGDEIEKEVTPTSFGRIAAQYAEQYLKQHIRRAEKILIYEEFKDRTGDIVRGIVRRFERSDVIIDLGRYEAVLPNRERVPIEEYQPGEQLRCLVKAVEEGGRGPEIILSRSDPDFVIKLFSLEVSEIADGTVEIVAVAREPGWRTKLAVHSSDSRVDPVGACVGLRGQRVKNIVRELNNEKVDIIHWSSDIKTFVAEALKPAVLKDIELIEADKRIKITVIEDQLSLAIGKRGQNARLASRLIGWQIDIDGEKVETLTFDDQVADAITALAALPGIDEALANALVTSGFHTEDDLKQIEPGDLEGIPGLEEHTEAIIAAANAEPVEATEAAEPEAPAETEAPAEMPEAAETTEPEAEPPAVEPEAEPEVAVEESKSDEPETAEETEPETIEPNEPAAEKAPEPPKDTAAE